MYNLNLNSSAIIEEIIKEHLIFLSFID